MSKKSVEYVLDKATAGKRLYFDETLNLYRHADLAELGAAARQMRQRRVPGQIVTYQIDQQIPITNVCVTGCHFCNTPQSSDAPDAYVQSRDEIARYVETLITGGGTRVLLQGRQHPDLDVDWYADLVGWLHEGFPTLEIEGFNPPEIAHMAQVSDLPIAEVLQRLQAAGLRGLDGGGAEILDDQIRTRYAPRKQRSDGWLSVMRQAHRLGLQTSATLVMGFDETPEQRIHHLQRLRSLQDYSLNVHGNGFNAFISWVLPQRQSAYLPANTLTENFGVTPREYLRLVAIARLFLDNIPHHQTNWTSLGAAVSQQALSYGLDDFGTIALASEGCALPDAHLRGRLREATVCDLIRQAGYTPAQRDSAYHICAIQSWSDQPVEHVRYTSPGLEPAQPLLSLLALQPNWN